MTGGDTKPTLEYVLREHAVDRRVLVERYKPAIMMVRQILGVVPHGLGYFEIWPPALTLHNLVVPIFFDIPKCDLGLGIRPELRSIVAYVTSRTQGCSYCSAHTAVLGTIFKGPGIASHLNSRTLEADSCPLFTGSDRAAIDYAMAIGPVPSSITLKQREGLAQHFSQEDEEAIVLIACLMGFLTCTMESLGTVIEWQVLNEAEKHLSSSGWTSGQSFDEKWDEGIAQDDREFEPSDATLGLFALIPQMVGAMKYERRSLSTIAGSARGLQSQLQQSIGFVPYYFRTLRRISPKRVLALALVEHLWKSGPNLTNQSKLEYGFAYSTMVENDILVAHSAYLARRSGVPLEQLRSLQSSCTHERAETSEDPCLRFAFITSRTPTHLSPADVTYYASTLSPECIVELLDIAGVYALLHRLTSTYPATKYEDEIRAFVEGEEGIALALKPTPNEHAVGWETACKATRASAKTRS